MKAAVEREIAAYEQIQAEAAGRIVHERGLAILCAEGVLPPTNRVSRCLGAVMETMHADKVLDLGCGTGFLALLAARFARAVIGVDIDPRAVACARQNAALNGAENVCFLEGDGYGPVAGQRFDLILSNPPFYPEAGRRYAPRPVCATGRGSLLQALIEGLPEHLEPGGMALFVTSSLSDNGAVEAWLGHLRLPSSRGVLYHGSAQEIYLWEVRA